MLIRDIIAGRQNLCVRFLRYKKIIQSFIFDEVNKKRSEYYLVFRTNSKKKCELSIIYIFDIIIGITFFQTTYSTAFALYHLAKNPTAQENLHREAVTLLADNNEPVNAETLRKASYTKAVIKETFRLNPISVGIGRILQTDAILSGYRVPKGVSVDISKVVARISMVCRHTLKHFFIIMLLLRK